MVQLKAEVLLFNLVSTTRTGLRAFMSSLTKDTQPYIITLTLLMRHHPSFHGLSLPQRTRSSDFLPCFSCNSIFGS